MKQKLLSASRLMGLLTLCSFLFAPLYVEAQASYNAPHSKWWEVVEQEVNGTLNFYDHKGATETSDVSYTTMVRFKPASTGPLTITFNSFSAPHYTGGKVHIYDGKVEWGSEPDPDDDWGEVNTIPNNPKITIKDGDTMPITFTATNAEGIITIVIESESTSKMDFEAILSEPIGTGSSMTFQEVKVDEKKDTITVGTQQAVLLAFDIFTQGTENPLSLSTAKVNGIGTGFSNLKIQIGNAEPIHYVGARGSFTPTPLKAGKNHIVILGDIAPTMSTSGENTLTLQEIVLGGKTTPLSANNSTTHIYTKVALMEQPSATILVQDELDFYDDGGKDNKISKSFKGATTFVPATASHKVTIDFTKIDIGYSDKVRIYAGKSVDASALLLEVDRTTKPFSITSSANDGSITVYVEGSQYYTGEGFEAKVTAGEPKAMVFKGASLKELKLDEPLSAVSKDGAIATLSIETEHTTPALELASLSFAIEGGIKEISLFSAKEKDKTEFGRIAVAEGANTATLTLTSPQALGQFGNDFLVKVSIDEKAANQSSYKLTLTELIAKDDSKLALTTDNAVSGKIANNAIATIGTQTITLHSDWGFTHEKASKFNSNTATKAGDRIVTFTTPEAGKVVSINFESFEIKYPFQGSPEPVFKVIDGDQTTGTVIWEMSRTTNKGPQMKLFSTGQSLMVLFNAHGGYQSKGWQATVSSDQAPRLGIMEQYQEALGTEVLSVFSSDESDLAKLVIKAIATSPAQQLKSVEVKLEGNTSFLKQLALYQLKGTSRELVATLANPSAGNHTFAIASEKTITLETGENQFVLVAIPQGGTGSDNKVTLSFTKYTLSPNEVFDVVAPSTPITKSFVSIIEQHTTAETKSYTIPEGKKFTYTDEGGLTGKMQEAPYTSTLTFKPSKEGEIVVLDIKELAINRNVTFGIYDGTEAKVENKLAEHKAKASSLIYWGSLQHQGALTIKVEKKKTSYAAPDGWNIEVYTQTPSDRTITNHKVLARRDREALLGSMKEVAFDLEYVIEGQQNGVKIPRIEVKAPKATAAYLVFGGDNMVFNTSFPSIKATKEAGSDIFVLEDKTTYTLNGKVYAYVALDIPTEGADNETLEAEITRVGDKAYSDKKITFTLRKGMSGEYTLGASAGSSYKKFSDLERDLGKKGVSGPVTILVENGTYEEPLTLSYIQGASENNPITIKSLSGKTEDVVITHRANAASYGYRAPKGFVRIEGTPFVTLENLTIKMTNKVADDAIHVSNASHNFTLRECIVDVPTKEPSSYSDRIGGMVITNDGSNDYTHCDNLLVERCRFIGGDIALDMKNGNNVAYQDASNYIIRNNVFENNYSKSVYVSSPIIGLLVENNSINIDIIPSTNNSDIWAMDVTLGAAGEKIVGNRIYSTNHDRVTGLYLRKSRGPKVYTQGSLVANNSVVITNPSKESKARFAGVKGIFFSDEKLENITIAYNSIRLEVGESIAPSEGATFKNDAFATGMEIKSGKNIKVLNNLVYNSRRGRAVAQYGVEHAHYQSNAYYTPSEKPFMYQYTDPTDTKAKNFEGSFDEWKDKQTEEKSVFLKPEFVDETSCVLKNGNLFRIASPLAEVTQDLAGNVRNTTTPTAGAFEHNDDLGKELKLNEVSVVSTTALSATISFKAERTLKLYYQVVKADEMAPSKETLLAKQATTYAPGITHELKIEELEPTTDYKLYGVLEATSETLQSGVLALVDFTTANLPTQPATFNDVKDYTVGQPFVDGTMKFTGFTIEKEASNGFAKRADNTTAEVELTNTKAGLTLKSLLIRGKGEVTITTDLNATRVLKLDDDKRFVLVAIEKLGLIKKLTIAGGTNVAIDDFGAMVEELVLYTPETIVVSQGEKVIPTMDSQFMAVPYKATLKRGDKEIVLEEVWTNSTSFEAVEPKATEELVITIEDELGRKANTSFFTVVNTSDGKAAMATFEEPINDEDGDFRRKRSFYSGSFGFKNSFVAQWNSWSGFAVSRSKETTFDMNNYLTDQFNVPSGKGARNSESFGVFFKSYGSDDQIVVVDPLVAQPLTGMWVSITSYTLNHVEKGDSFFDGGFKDGNYYEVILTADNNKVVTIPVADYRNGKKEVLKDWTWVSFEELGNIKSFTLKVDGNVKNEYGLLTPAYLAIDNINDPKKGGLTDNASVIRSEKVELMVAGNALVVENGEDVVVTIYDLAGRVVNQLRPTSNHYSHELALPQGTYIIVAASEQIKVQI